MTLFEVAYLLVVVVAADCGLCGDGLQPEDVRSRHGPAGRLVFRNDCDFCQTVVSQTHLRSQPFVNVICNKKVNTGDDDTNYTMPYNEQMRFICPLIGERGCC